MKASLIGLALLSVAAASGCLQNVESVDEPEVHEGLTPLYLAPASTAELTAASAALVDIQVFGVPASNPSAEPTRLRRLMVPVEGDLSPQLIDLKLGASDPKFLHLVVRLDGDGDGGLCGGGNDYFGVGAWFSLDERGRLPTALRVDLKPLATGSPCVAM